MTDSRWRAFSAAEIKELCWIVGQGAEELHAGDLELARHLSYELHEEYTIREGK